MKKSRFRLQIKKHGCRYAAALLLTGSIASAVTANAQSLSPAADGPESCLTQTQSQGWMARAQNMFNLGNYQAAADQLRAAIAAEPDAEAKLKGELLLARTLLMLGDDECIRLADNIIRTQGTSPAGREALLTKADRLFFKEQYGPASLCYAQIPDVDLTPLYAYRQGVSLLRCGKFDKGRSLLSALAAKSRQYRAPADFYLAWADYAQERYEKALSGFEAVQPLLPAVNAASQGHDNLYLPSQLDANYFIAQIAFRQGNYNRALSLAQDLLKQYADNEYTRELNRLAGESLFKLDNYSAAEPYLQNYLTLTGESNIKPSAAYALGAIAYADGRTQLASQLLEPIAAADNIVGQGAALLMGQIAANQGDLTAAALYFERAWRDGEDQNLAEQAMYNHIAASAQGATTPFSSATELPERFLQLFPGSRYEAPVREYLSAAYFRDKDYARALESLNKIPSLSASQLKARQLVLYELGISEVSNGQYAAAENHLLQTLTGPDSHVASQAQIWLGQALYAQAKFNDAERAFRSYLSQQPNGANAAQATYDAAYALYMQDNFAKASAEFKKALDMKSLPARLRTDALVRLADCQYYLRNYAQAAELYAQAENQTDGDRAYAAMRAAMMQGLRGDLAAEIQGLKRMIASYPQSRWRPAAMYELATAQAKTDDLAAAASTYSNLAQTFGQLEEGRRAQLQLAHLYAKQGDDLKAIEEYKTVIRRWPTGDEAKAANVELKRLMAEQGEIAQYAAFINSVPGAPKIDNAELERLSYEAADNRLIASASDTEPMLNYLNQYPDGLYLAAALWRLAQAYEETGQFDKALSAIDRMQQGRPDARQLPEALILKGLLLEEHYPDRNAEALQAYRTAERQLGANTPQELYAGIMRLTDNADEQLDYAHRLQNMGGLTSDQAQEADFYEAQALQAQGNTPDAAAIYKSLASQPSTLYGARAAVAYSEMLLTQKKYKEAEKLLTSFTNTGTPHQYWLARGYIALADAVAAQGRKSLARQYINALKANYPGRETDIQQAIANRLNRY